MGWFYKNPPLSSVGEGRFTAAVVAVAVRGSIGGCRRCDHLQLVQLSFKLSPVFFKFLILKCDLFQLLHGFCVLAQLMLLEIILLPLTLSASNRQDTKACVVL